ncbi:hypothetical protein C2R22_05750 [Salinigranum rubrum]|uniref:Uncharacterized protein n=1 Tax=Salinigranum rubrum TaxID=755307 RepID=A0A2I8VPT9_9EURY|nr:hypothetical protein C2R22_05750 [Salinigranum rubrum]
MTDGGRPVHRADCRDCAWSYSDTDQVDVSDELERHARKEQHDVRFTRAVATDGGRVRHPGGGIETLAGVGDQHPPECVAGRPDCPGVGAPGDDLPCLQCLSEGGEP